MLICPCKGCINRSPVCHNDCRDYFEWKRDLARIAEAQREQNYTIHSYDFLGTSPPPGKHVPRRKKRYGSRYNR